MKHATEFPGAELVAEFLATLDGRSDSTRAVYGRTLYRLAGWIATRPGAQRRFIPADFTRTALTTYLDGLEQQGYSLSHRSRVRVVAGRFARWLIEERGLLRRNPARDIILPPQPQLAPRELSGEQRFGVIAEDVRNRTLRAACGRPGLDLPVER